MKPPITVPTAMNAFTSGRRSLEPFAGVCLLRFSLAAVAVLLMGSNLARAAAQPAAPLASSAVQPTAVEKIKAYDLGRLARAENRRLKWDDCLARQAFLRAKKLVTSGTFAHQDPRTGKNPAWRMVVQCNRYRFAGENLTKGHQSAEAIHRALMQSPTHRANIVNPAYRYLGVGCYDSVCVQFFAGL